MIDPLPVGNVGNQVPYDPKRQRDTKKPKKQFRSQEETAPNESAAESSSIDGQESDDPKDDDTTHIDIEV